MGTIVDSRSRIVAAFERRGVHYGWVVAGVSFLTLITAAGFRSTAGVLIVPLQDEFGWSRATISAAVSINLVLYGLGGPFAAGLYDASKPCQSVGDSPSSTSTLWIDAPRSTSTSS